MSIRQFENTAKTAREKKILASMEDNADRYAESIASMPDWAFGNPGRIDVRVPLAVIAENSDNRDNIHVTEFVSKSGRQMVSVEWEDRYGKHVTQSTGNANSVMYSWYSFEF